MRHQGRIANWKQDKGFGFIRADDGTQNIFIHVKDLRNRSRVPVSGDPVSYKLSLDGQTRLQAVSVRFQDEGIFYFRMPHRRALLTAFILTYALVLGALVHTSRLSPYVFLAVLLLSVISYLAYRNDKRASERGGWRTAESQLHLLSLLGGWPGALIAQSLLRHKSSKSGFRIVFYVTVTLNIIGIVALFYY